MDYVRCIVIFGLVIIVPQIGAYISCQLEFITASAALNFMSLFYLITAGNLLAIYAIAKEGNL